MNTKPYMQAPYMMKLKGKDYMIVAGRLLWFRDVHPDGSILTDTQAIGSVIIVKHRLLLTIQSLQQVVQLYEMVKVHRGQVVKSKKRKRQL